MISIKDGHDAVGVVNALDVVPVGATAITYNITIGAPTGPNFVAVTPGDAASFLASAVNFNGTADIANAATVAIDANRQIKVWGGDQSRFGTHHHRRHRLLHPAGAVPEHGQLIWTSGHGSLSNRPRGPSDTECVTGCRSHTAAAPCCVSRAFGEIRAAPR